MKYRLFLLIIIVAALLQVTLVPHVKIFGVKPDLLFVMSAYASFFFSLPWALFFSLCAGGLKDIYGIYGIGFNALLFCLWSLIFIKVSRKIATDTNPVRSVCIFIAVLSNGLAWGSVLLSKGCVIPFGIFIRTVLLDAAYTAAAALLLLPWFEKILLPFQDHSEPETETEGVAAAQDTAYPRDDTGDPDSCLGTSKQEGITL